MKPRERMMGIAVGVGVVLILGYVAFSYVSGQFGRRQADIQRLEGDIARAKRDVLSGERAQRKIEEYQARSLPADPGNTVVLYNNWLTTELQKAGLTQPDVAQQGITHERGLYVKQTFKVAAKGTLPQVVDWLHAFYGVDWLHKISQFKLTPIKDSKQLTLTATIETLSLQKADNPTELTARPSKRLKLPDRQAYHDAIVNRNVFGPPNNPPRLAVSGSRDVFVNRSVSLTIRGTDPDPLDKVRYRLVQAPDDSARLNEETGQLSWTPRQTGRYEFAFEAIDDGYPNLASRPERFIVNVTEQPPPSRPVVEFDHARFTVLTAVLDLDGQGEVWLHVRPLGEIVKLHQGDRFQIGTIAGTIVEIGQYDLTFTSNGKLHKLSKGDMLAQAKEIGDAPVARSEEPAAPAEASGDSNTTPAAVPAGAATGASKDNRAS
jgi:hypothetical protein